MKCFSVPSPTKSARSSTSKDLIIEKVKFNFFLFYLTAYFFEFVRIEIVKCFNVTTTKMVFYDAGVTTTLTKPMS